jgi:hypothetical protein
MGTPIHKAPIQPAGFRRSDDSRLMPFSNRNGATD